MTIMIIGKYIIPYKVINQYIVNEKKTGMEVLTIRSKETREIAWITLISFFRMTIPIINSILIECTATEAILCPENNKISAIIINISVKISYFLIPWPPFCFLTNAALPNLKLKREVSNWIIYTLLTNQHLLGLNLKYTLHLKEKIPKCF